MTECLVKSIRKFTPYSKIYLFDNSDKYPFTYRTNDMVYLDNTSGQIINFDAFLDQHRGHLNMEGATVNNYGSLKHCLTIQKAMDIIGEAFILLDSDVLLKKDITPLANKNYIYAGSVSTTFHKTPRVLPYICYINVPMCREHGITYYDRDHIYGLEYTEKSRDYDTGGYFYLATSGLPHKTIYLGEYIVHYQAASWLDDAKQKHRYRPRYTMEEFIELNKNLWDTTMSKNVVYTCITGGYDTLEDPTFISEGFDYVCFTDAKEIKSRIWKYRPIPEELASLSNVKKQRAIKLCPHKYLPEYDLSIWVDGSITVRGNMNDFVSKNCTDGNIFIPKHPVRSCIYKEMNTCEKMKKDTVENIERMRKKYQEEGFPQSYGLVQSNIIVRRHNEPDCIRLMDAWWKVLKEYSHRDQLSFNYVLWKNKDIKVTLLDKRTCKSQYFNWDPFHGSKKTSFRSDDYDAFPIRPAPKKQTGVVKTVVTKNPAPKYHSKIITGNEEVKRREISDRLRAFLKK